jgi:hypothetical protein
MLEILALISVLSLAVTKSVDFVRNAFDKAGTAPKWVWNVAALAIGVGYCVGWQLDITEAILSKIPALADDADRLAGLPGQILSGLLAGGGAGFWHELLDMWSARGTTTPARS